MSIYFVGLVVLTLGILALEWWGLGRGDDD